jgi:amino acid adenylation domain-containing protein
MKEEKIVEGFRLSPLQTRLWAYEHATGKNGRALCLVAVDGDLQYRRLIEALEALVNSYEILRTRFEMLPGSTLALQVIGGCAFVLSTHNWSEMPNDRQASAVETLWHQMGSAPLHLEGGPALELILVRLSPVRHRLLISLPDLVADGATLGNFVRELARIYTSLSEDKTLVSPNVPQYADLAEWQNQLLESPEAEAGRAYWRRQVAPPLLLRDLPLGYALITHPEADPKGTSIRQAEDARSRLQQIARQQHVEPETVALSCWCILLYRLSGLSEFTIGLTSDARRHDDLRLAFGPLSTVFPFVVRVTKQKPFRALVDEIDKRISEARRWDFLYDSDTTSSDHEPSRFPICFDGCTSAAPCSADGVTFSVVRRWSSAAPFELKATYTTAEDGTPDIAFDCDPKKVSSAFVQRLASMFVAILSHASVSPYSAVCNLDLLEASETKKVLVDFNRTRFEYPNTECLHQLIEKQVLQGPNAAAVRLGAESLSYAELNTRANQLAHYLRGRGVRPDMRVAICTHRGFGMAVGLLAILKAGGAYVPLDPTYPRERIRSMLADSAPVALLTQTRLAKLFLGTDVRLIDLDADAAQWANQPDTNPGPMGLTPDHLCYVIYTSGSTGKPKGVMNPHRCVVNRLTWGQRTWSLQTGETMLCKTSLSFDGSLRELFWPWSVGACVAMARPEGQKDVDYLLDTIEREQVRTLNLVPSMLQMLLDHPDVAKLSGIRQILCGGEALPAVLAQRLRECLPDVRLHNLYGPSEAATALTALDCRPATGCSTLPVGKPVGNTRVYILDAQKQPVPMGFAGELHIGGAGVGRGYLNRPELTAEKFIPDSFDGQSGSRLYATGDRVRHRADGAIEFLGRIDHQAKIRGNRVEPGEVEAVLSLHPQVKQIVVTAQEDVRDETELVAYLVCNSDAVPGVDVLRRFAAERLPDFMIPSRWVVVPALPLLANGKVDRRNLSLPSQNLLRSSAECAPPRSNCEHMMVGIWAELLRRKNVGIHDNFFDLGGNSLLAMRIVSRVRRDFGVFVPLHKLFECPTPADLATEVTASQENPSQTTMSPIEALPRSARRPEEAAQQLREPSS